MARVSRSDIAGRVAIVCGLIGAFFAGYFAIAAETNPSSGAVPSTRLDGAIPFLPASVLLYGWVYTSAVLPLFVVRSRDLFARTVGAYVSVLVVALVCFALFPVTCVGLRPDPRTLDPTRFATWALRLVYTLDPPVNLFPSVHIAIATLASLAAWKARRLYGTVALVVLGPVAVSICTTKQHYAVDGIAGAALAAAAYAVWIRPHRAAPGEPDAWGWCGPALYLVLHSLIYAAAFLAFRAGLAPWRG